MNTLLSHFVLPIQSSSYQSTIFVNLVASNYHLSIIQAIQNQKEKGESPCTKDGNSPINKQRLKPKSKPIAQFKNSTNKAQIKCINKLGPKS